mgnify:CR=1 FL=1
MGHVIAIAQQKGGSGKTTLAVNLAVAATRAAIERFFAEMAAQDVAVNGMCIYLVPIEEEGRLNSYLSFGKAVGWATFTAIIGTLLVEYGTRMTALVCSLGAAVVFVYLLLVRERHGERLLPWTAGEASPKNEPPPSFREMFTDLNHVLWTRASLVMMFIMFMAGMFSGYGRALMPIAAQIEASSTSRFPVFVDDLDHVRSTVSGVARCSHGCVGTVRLRIRSRRPRT